MAMIGAIGSGGARLAALTSLAAQVPQASTLPAPPSGAAGLSSGAGRVGAQTNPQPAAPNAIAAPDKVVRADLGAPSRPGVLQRTASVDPASFPAQAGQYHASEAAQAKVSSPQATGDWTGSLKGMMGGLQDEFAEMRRVTSTPIAAPSFPGGEAFAHSLNDVLHYEQMAVEYELGMALGGHVEKTSQKMISKITDMKD